MERQERAIEEPAGALPAHRLAHRRARFILAVAVTLTGVWILAAFLVPLVWAVVLAVATWPAYRWLVRGREQDLHGRVLAPLGATLLVGLLLMVPLTLVGVELARQLPALAHWIAGIEREGAPVPDWLPGLPMIGSYAADWWQANLSDPLGATELFGRVDRSLLIGWTRHLGAQIVHRGADLVVTLLALFFIFRSGRALTTELFAVTQRVFGKGGERLWLHMITAIKATVNGLILVGLGEGAVLGVAYGALGVPHPILLGAATGIAAAIPFAAPVIFVGAAALLFNASGIVPAAILLGIGFVVLFIADHFIRPVLIGNQTRLPFLFVLLGIFGGLESFGLVGLFIGPAVLSALMALWRDLAPEAVEVAAAER